MSRQSVYQQEQRRYIRQRQLEPVREMVLEQRRVMPRLGTRKLHHQIKPQLADANIKLGRDQLFDYLREQQLLVKPKRSYTKTTHSKHWLKKHPNLLDSHRPHEPERFMVGDITYVESDEGVHYLSLLTDSYSRKIVGHSLGRSLKAKESVKALKVATRNRTTQRPLIHHSDRGIQYCSDLYQKQLKAHHIKPSMTDGYDCYQNALAERVNGILKQEFLFRRCRTFDELKQLIDESVVTYNHLRPHLSLNMKTPDEVHKKASC